ncbi:MAG: hypothetical protein HYY03_00865 [Chloroflexi bacterium]|nr:hypothetical protein [Chloroflexota bacterium]
MAERRATTTATARRRGVSGGERGAARAQKEGASSLRHTGPSPMAGGWRPANAPFTEPGHRARLLQNYNYDLVEELSELLSGVWRIDAYLRDAGGLCDECGRVWQDVRKQKAFLIEKIRQEIVNHAKDGRFC